MENERRKEKRIDKKMLALCSIHNVSTRGVIDNYSRDGMKIVMLSNNNVEIGDKVNVSFYAVVDGKKTDVLVAGQIVNTEANVLDNRIVLNLKLDYISDDYITLCNMN